MKCVDEVVIFDGDDATDVIKRLRPAVITNGPDHKVDEIVGKAFVEQYGGRVAVTSGARGKSTTTIAKTIKGIDILGAVRDAQPLSPNPFNKLKLLADQYFLVNSLQGAAADVGTYRGACALILRRLAPERQLHCFDTWKGSPHEDPMCHHRPGEWAADLAECKRVVGTDPQTHYHEGVFPASAKGLEDVRFCFVVVDGDTYQTTKDAIEWFWERMVPGGKMFFDDWEWEPCSGVTKAVKEMFQADQRQIFAGEHGCVVTK
jgi:O-methyltransferase